MKKEFINEAKRMQQLAGILNEDNTRNDITDFCNTHFKELEEKFGKISTEFEPDTLLDGIEVTYAGTDEEDGITISFNPEYMNYNDDYNDIEKVKIAGKTIYVNDYLNSNRDEDEDEEF